MKKYLLVCEGPTDSIVIQRVAEKISSEIKNELKIVELAPQFDATTGAYEPFGWTQVRRWCKTYGKKSPAELAQSPLVGRKYWRALLAFSNAQGLIIQLDSDIAEQIESPELGLNLSKVSRRELCKAAILKWLNETGFDSQLFPVVATYSTETWILATYPRNEPIFSDLPDGFSFEMLHDVEQRLIQLKYAKKSGRLLKSVEKYKDYAGRVANKINDVRKECQEFNELCSKLEGL